MNRGINLLTGAILLLAIFAVVGISIYLVSHGTSQHSTSGQNNATSQHSTPEISNFTFISAKYVGSGKVLIENLGPKDINTSLLRTSDPEVNINCEKEILIPQEQTQCSLTGNPSSPTIAIYGPGISSATVDLKHAEESKGVTEHT